MTTVILTRWGNSIGIRIPATIIKEAHLSLGDELKIVANKKGTLTLRPIKNSQAGWVEAFNAIADSDMDEHLIDFPNDFDHGGWTW